MMSSDGADVYPNVKAERIEAMFSEQAPKGGTNTALALKGLFDIVSVKSFTQIRETGLVRALIDTMGEQSKLSLGASH